ncbi:MAG TPA: alpha-1,4-glucan--maltose-1-phosphate maltosyltransferase [Cyclobacteriaceae bacterium]|nr:alpha-1,4-glucan--maltose-1-phosphate maltosyltransferase [Cyclobacteriaceae bacterium]
MKVEINGQSRVIIENIQPQVDGGRYPAKRTVGERVDVSADILTDGHDHIRAEVLYRKEQDREWRSVEMEQAENDSWVASFVVMEKTPYVFTVQAWVDHFETWYDGFKKKASAKIDVSLELSEGAAFLKKIAADSNKELLRLADKFENKTSYQENVQFIMGREFGQIVHENPVREFVTRFSQEFKVNVEFQKALFSSWYELFPRSASLDGKHGTFQDVIKLLPRVASMGFDVLYLPPVHPIGKLNRKGKNNSVRAQDGEVGSPWAIGSDEGGHKAVHPELGTLDDYKKLITEAKKLNIDIALDLAYQCAPDHPYVIEHPEWFKQRPDGSIQYAENPPKKYQDIYPFNFECEHWQALWNELLSVILFWVDNGIKVFRVDNPHTKPTPFWEWAIAETHKLHPDIIFLSEAFTRPKIMNSLAKSGFTQSYTYFTWRVSKAELTDYMKELVHGPSRNYFRPNFWPNTPDILPYHLQHQGENIFILRFALAATLSSNYGMYGAAYEFYDNIPIEGKEEYLNSEKFEVKKYEWKRTNRMTDIISIVNKARKENKALQSTWNIRFCEIGDANLIAYIKATDDLSNIILTIVNLDPNNRHSGYMQLPKALLRLGDKINVKLHDLMTGENYTWTQEWNYVELNPYKIPFHLFVLTVHESNM